MFSLRLSSVFVSALVLSAASFASGLTVNNSSFEIGTGTHSENPDGLYFNGALDGAGFAGWMTSGEAGYWAPILGANTFGSLPDGKQAGFTGNGLGSGILYQDLSHAITFGETYSLSVYLGNRADLTAYGISPYGEISLADDLGNILATSGPLTAAAGTFELKTLSYMVTNGSSSIGHNLRIVLSGAGGTQMSYDDVAVNVSSVPGPAALVPFALGAIGTLRRRRR